MNGSYRGINFNRARMAPQQVAVPGGTMRPDIISAPTMREALMQQVRPQPVAEILSEGLPEMMPDLGGASSTADRKREIADLLTQRAMGRNATSIGTGLAQLGEAFIARGATKRADEAETTRDRITRDLLATAMGGGPDAAAARAQIEGMTGAPAALAAFDARQAAAQTAQQKQARLTALQNMPGLTDQQRALLAAGIGEEEAGKMAFAPAPEPVKYDSAADATGVRKYIEGPNIGKPVPGFETPRPERGGMQFSVDENGNPVVTFGGPRVPSSFGSRGEAVGATAFGTALTDADTADTTLALFNTAEGILDRGYNSGFFANLRGQAGAIASDVGINIPGFSKPENVADYEQFDSINKQLAAQMLKLFGGSDTERELAISIASNIGPRMGEETNRRMIATGKQLIERQRAKPEHIAQWNQRFGSLDAIDPQTGLGYQATWDRILQQLVSNAAGAASERRQSVIEQAIGGPPVGIIRNGYRFKGGNPNDSNNWEPVQ